MNNEYKEFKFPIIKSFTWKQVFKNKSMENQNEFFDLLSKILIYNPKSRINPSDALTHPFFNQIKSENLLFSDLIKLQNISKKEINNDNKEKIILAKTFNYEL